MNWDDAAVHVGRFIRCEESNDVGNLQAKRYQKSCEGRRKGNGIGTYFFWLSYPLHRDRANNRLQDLRLIKQGGQHRSVDSLATNLN